MGTVGAGVGFSMRPVVLLCSALVVAALAFVLAGLINSRSGNAAAVEAAQPSGIQSPSAARARLSDFAYRQMRKQSEKTCQSVPRKVLARAFAEASIDPDLAEVDPTEASDNYLALWYAEDVRTRPIRLQQAAYDGCLAGLTARR